MNKFAPIALLATVLTFSVAPAALRADEGAAPAAAGSGRGGCACQPVRLPVVRRTARLFGAGGAARRADSAGLRARGGGAQPDAAGLGLFSFRWRCWRFATNTGTSARTDPRPETLSHPLRTVVRMEVGMIRAMAAAVRPGDLAACRRELAEIAMVQSILSGLELRVLRAMREFSADAEGEHARATNSSSRKSAKARKRADAAEAIPQLDEALSEGETTAEHVDVVADVLAGLSPADRARVAGMGDEIRAKATQVGESEFRRWLQMMVRRLRQDDAVARLARQKGACRANWWLDQEGMWNLRGRFDAETGARLQGRLRGATEVLAQGPLPEGAPDDPLERHQWLQAQALASLIDGDIETAGGPEMLMVIDAETVIKGEHERTVLDMCGL